MIDGGKRVSIAIEGVGPLVMNVVRDQWDWVDGRLVRTSLPTSERDLARLRISRDEYGRPALRWSHLLWLIAGRPCRFVSSSARYEMGLDVERGGLAIEGEWEPLRRTTSLFGVRSEEVVAVFPTWKASGVLVFEARLWREDELRGRVEAAGLGMYEVVAWEPLCEAVGAL
ncbi:hypothetical protein [Paludisphaera rhizosphaerae]|uniref:hypothetical protein n=1 Tax=Paludisphaera rhizosphaerae TaxID=2711216 RepID=UPI0013ED8643|nr:hypothetical protein [Paludisphaera rhizosphaerae]